MEMQMKGLHGEVLNADQEIAAADFPRIQDVRLQRGLRYLQDRFASRRTPKRSQGIVDLMLSGNRRPLHGGGLLFRA